MYFFQIKKEIEPLVKHKEIGRYESFTCGFCNFFFCLQDSQHRFYLNPNVFDTEKLLENNKKSDLFNIIINDTNSEINNLELNDFTKPIQITTQKKLLKEKIKMEKRIKKYEEKEILISKINNLLQTNSKEIIIKKSDSGSSLDGKLSSPLSETFSPPSLKILKIKVNSSQPSESGSSGTKSDFTPKPENIESPLSGSSRKSSEFSPINKTIKSPVKNSYTQAGLYIYLK